MSLEYILATLAALSDKVYSNNPDKSKGASAGTFKVEESELNFLLYLKLWQPDCSCFTLL